MRNVTLKFIKEDNLRNNWKAGYSESCKSGLEGGCVKTCCGNAVRRCLPTLHHQTAETVFRGGELMQKSTIRNEVTT